MINPWGASKHVSEPKAIWILEQRKILIPFHILPHVNFLFDIAETLEG